MKFYNLALSLTPLMEEILRVTLHESTKMTLTPLIVSDIDELQHMLNQRISQKNAKKLNKFYKKLQLNQYAGSSVESVLLNSGFMPEIRSDLTLGQGYLAKKYEIIVKFKQQLSEPKVVSNRLVTGISSVDKVLSSYAVESIQPLFADIKHKKSISGLDRIYKIRLQDGVNASELIKGLSLLPEVEYVEENKIYNTLSDDVYFPFQYALENTKVPDADIDAQTAWTIETGDPSVLVSVVDTGVDYNRSDLAGGKVRVDLDYDFVNLDNDATDDNGHGTHVAGIIGASYNNSYNIAGVAPDISIVPFKVLDDFGSGTSDDVASGITKSVDAGARVINLSLGGSFANAIEDSLIYADENGVLSIAAAGNDGASKISYPANSEYTVSVGATNKKNKRAGFSNYGKGLDLMAPGVAIVSLYRNGLTCNLSGTSMATPHVVGVAALVISNKGPLSIADIKTSLFEHAFDLGKPGYDTVFGWGLVQAPSFVDDK
jgi:cell wall-associated protease